MMQFWVTSWLALEVKDDSSVDAPVVLVSWEWCFGTDAEDVGEVADEAVRRVMDWSGQNPLVCATFLAGSRVLAGVVNPELVGEDVNTPPVELSVRDNRLFFTAIFPGGQVDGEVSSSLHVECRDRAMYFEECAQRFGTLKTQVLCEIARCSDRLETEGFVSSELVRQKALLKELRFEVKL